MLFSRRLFSQWIQLWHFKLVWMIAHGRFEGNLRLQVPGKVVGESGRSVPWYRHIGTVRCPPPRSPSCPLTPPWRLPTPGSPACCTGPTCPLTMIQAHRNCTMSSSSKSVVSSNASLASTHSWLSSVLYRTNLPTYHDTGTQELYDVLLLEVRRVL